MSELYQSILDHEDAFKSKARLASLYSDFAVFKSTNPDAYNANISTWHAALLNASRAGLTLGNSVFTLNAGDELATALESKAYGKPLALGAVVNDAVHKRDMIPLKEFLNAKTSIYKKSWINVPLPTPWQIAQWALRQVGLGSTNKAADGEYVIMAYVEDATRKLLADLSKTSKTRSALIYSLETFKHTFSAILSPTGALSPTDISILVAYLTRDNPVASFSGTTIKFAPNFFSTILAPVTENDITIASLNMLSLSLTSQISALQTRIDSLDKAARNSVSLNQRARALSSLRAKKLAETTIQRREASLAQVDGVLSSIDEAAGQVEMVRAMEASGKVLRDLNAAVGGVEKVETVMNIVRKGMADVEDVSRVFAEESSGGAIDEAEVDEELEMLERAQKEKEEEREASELPSVPSGVPVARERQREQEDVEKRLSAMSLDEMYLEKAA